MDKETKVDSFLAGLEEPNVEVGDELALFPEEKEEEEIPEKPVAFHKDEKVQRYIDRQVEKRLKDFKPSAEQTFKEEVSQGEPKFISSLEKIIGNDTPEKLQAIKDLKEDWDGLSKQARQNALNEILEAQQEQVENEQAELEEAVDELDEMRETIEDYRGKPLTEKQWDAYKEYLLDNEPRGGYQEYPDAIKSFNRFVPSVSRSNATAKTLASRSMERSAPASNQEAPKGNSWKDWEAEKEKLLNR
jgi:DNA repair exonuclease SbcCD ATPase subunit